MNDRLYFANDPKPTPITLETALADLATTLDAGEMRMVNVALACARLEWSRATPPDGPVVWVARDKGTGGSLWLFRGEAPERVVHADRVDYFPQEGDPAHRLGSWVDDWALDLAPGECVRVRITREEAPHD